MPVNPNTAWGQQFEAIGYSLDPTILSSPFTVVSDLIGASDRVAASVEVTLADILSRTSGHEVGDIDTGPALAFASFPPDEPRMDSDRLRQLGVHAHLVSIATGAGYLVAAGTAFNCRLSRILLEFRSKGVNPFDATWYWYDSAHVRDDPQESYSFFLVHHNAIVHEGVKIFDSPGYAFDATVFCRDDASEVWSSDKGWSDARGRFWYRRFYRDTIAGQLMVLRSDEPMLFHYPEGELTRLLYRSSDEDGRCRDLEVLLASIFSRK